MAARSIVLLKPEPCIPRGADPPQLRGSGPSHCSPCTSWTARVYSNELETASKKWQQNVRVLHLTGDHAASCIQGLWSVLQTYSLQRNTWVAVEKEGQNLRNILQKHRLDFKYGIWAKNLASLFISYPLPSRTEGSRLASQRAENRHFPSIFLHAPAVTYGSLSITLRSPFSSVSLKKYNWHWKCVLPALLCSGRHGKCYKPLSWTQATVHTTTWVSVAGSKAGQGSNQAHPNWPP